MGAGFLHSSYLVLAKRIDSLRDACHTPRRFLALPRRAFVLTLARRLALAFSRPLLLQQLWLAITLIAMATPAAAQPLQMPGLIGGQFGDGLEHGFQPEPNHAPYQSTLQSDEGYGVECGDCADDMTWQAGGGWHGVLPEPITVWFARCSEFFSRSAATDGRSIGLGGPLRGTSWLNRPYEVAVDFGAFVMTNNPASGVNSGNDLFTAIHAGWDWDHYWGTQFRVGWSTPSLDAVGISGEQTSDNLFITDLSVMYYPWGDSRFRPYWRLGLGLTDIEYTNAAGNRQQEALFTVPIGVGMKYQFRRSLVWRAELVDNVAFGSNSTDTMNNLTLTFGLEARFGGRPSGYWAWHPRGHAW